MPRSSTPARSTVHSSTATRPATSRRSHRSTELRADKAIRGSDHGRARLTEAQVARARTRIRAGRSTVTKEAERCGVDTSTMHHAVFGLTWKHVPGALGAPVVRATRVARAKPPRAASKPATRATAGEERKLALLSASAVRWLKRERVPTGTGRPEAMALVVDRTMTELRRLRRQLGVEPPVATTRRTPARLGSEKAVATWVGAKAVATLRRARHHPSEGVGVALDRVIREVKRLRAAR